MWCSSAGCGAEARWRCSGCYAPYCDLARTDSAHRAAGRERCGSAWPPAEPPTPYESASEEEDAQEEGVSGAGAVATEIGAPLRAPTPSYAWTEAAKAIVDFVYVAAWTDSCTLAERLEKLLTTDYVERTKTLKNINHTNIYDVLTPRPGDRAASSALRKLAADYFGLVKMRNAALDTAVGNFSWWASQLDAAPERARLRRFIAALPRLFPSAALVPLKIAALAAALDLTRYRCDACSEGVCARDFIKQCQKRPACASTRGLHEPQRSNAGSALASAAKIKA